jgi:hypothetical protein
MASNMAGGAKNFCDLKRPSNAYRFPEKIVLILADFIMFFPHIGKAVSCYRNVIGITNITLRNIP